MSDGYRFGHFEIDARRRELRRAGEPVDVQPKVLDVIVHLLRNRERVVSRQELLDALWGDAAVSEGVLTTAVHAARTALDDTASRAWAIKTVARHGYRFVAPVEDARGPDGAGAPKAARDVWDRDPFVGRTRLVARIGAAAASAAEGRGRVLIVSGESGIGKTRLLDELMARAGSWDMRGVLASCDLCQTAPAYVPWTSVLRRLVEESDPAEVVRDLGAGAPDLAALVPAIRALLPEVPQAPRLQSGTVRFRLFESVQSFLAHAAAHRPLLLLLDDVHAADHASLRLLAHLAREVRHLAILLVATLREHGGAPDPVLEETLAEIARHFPGQRLRLEGLGREEVAELVARLTDGALEPGWVDTIVTRSEGNPFFVREIVGLIEAASDTDEGAGPRLADWASGIPPGVRDVILERLHRLGAEGQAVLTAAAVVGRSFRVGVVAELLGRDAAAIADALAEACTSGLVRAEPADADAYRFSHALVHETLYDDAGASERRRLHRRAGEVLESLGGVVAAPLADLARHFLRAGDADGLAKAVDHAVAAAEQAHGVHAYDEAAKLYGMALDALERTPAPDDGRRCEILIALGAAQLGARMGDPRGRDSLLRAADIARRRGDPGQLARAALAVAATALQSGPRDEAITRILEAALEVVDPAEHVLRARLMASLAFQLRSADQRERSLLLCEEALALARKSGDAGTVCEVLNSRCALLSGPGHAAFRLRDADELLALAAEAHATELGLFGHRWRISAMLEAGDVKAADGALAAYDAAVDRGRIWSGRWFGLTLRAARALAEARFDAAERMVVESFAHRRDETTPLIIGTFAAQLFWLRREQGRLEEVGHLRRHDSPHLAFGVLRVLLDAETGEEEAARARLRDVVAHRLDRLPDDFTLLYILTTLAEAAVTLGDAESARPLYRALAPYADQYVTLFIGAVQQGSASRALGALAALLGECDLAEQHFADALVANRRIGAHLHVARTRLDWATALARAPGASPDRVRELLVPCLAEAHERGMAVVAHRARDALDALRG